MRRGGGARQREELLRLIVEELQGGGRCESRKPQSDPNAEGFHVRMGAQRVGERLSRESASRRRAGAVSRCSGATYRLRDHSAGRCRTAAVSADGARGLVNLRVRDLADDNLAGTSVIVPARYLEP